VILRVAEEIEKHYLDARAGRRIIARLRDAATSNEPAEVADAADSCERTTTPLREAEHALDRALDLLTWPG
jgi:hypothetical protein